MKFDIEESLKILYKDWLVNKYNENLNPEEDIVTLMEDRGEKALFIEWAIEIIEDY